MVVVFVQRGPVGAPVAHGQILGRKVLKQQPLHGELVAHDLHLSFGLCADKRPQQPVREVERARRVHDKGFDGEVWIVLTPDEQDGLQIVPSVPNQVREIRSFQVQDEENLPYGIRWVQQQVIDILVHEYVVSDQLPCRIS